MTTGHLTVQVAVLFITLCVSANGAGEEPNPYNGRQQRVEVFEFVQKPMVQKRGEAFVISFESKETCDATVMIVDEDGKVVRHLASGVLGKNAPAPYEQGSLAQKLTWDGKDDRGEVVDVSKCRVKVGLGLRASLDRFIGWTPGTVSVLKGLATDNEGRLVVLDGRVAQGQGGGFTITPNVRMFDRQGDYVRRLVPPSPLLSPARSQLVPLKRLDSGNLVPTYKEVQLQFSISKPDQMHMGTLRQQPVVTADGRFIFVSTDHRHALPRQLIFVDTYDGATQLRPITGEKEDTIGPGYVFTTLSPDDKWLYLCAGNAYNAKEAEQAKHVVFRVAVDGDGPAKVFLGEYGKAGADNEHLSLPLGLDCDAAGNLYVADHGNDRIQVFSPEGKFLKSIPMKMPELVEVSDKTGAIYVMGPVVKHTGRAPIVWDRQSEPDRLLGGNMRSHVVKFSSLAEPTRHVLIEEFVAGGADSGPLMELDDRGEVPVLWLSAHHWDLQRFEDRDGKLVRTSTESVCGGNGYWRGWNSDGFADRIVVDPFRSELYVAHSRGGWFVVDARTGEFKHYVGHANGRNIGNPGQPPVSEIEIGPDQNVYARVSALASYLTCFDPHTKEFVGLTGSAKSTTVTDRRGLTFSALPIPNDQGARGWPDAMAIAPNGDFYIPNGKPTEEEVAELKRKGLYFPTQKEVFGPSTGNLLKVYAKDGTIKCMSALPGMLGTVGMRVGRSGAVYTVMPCRPIDKEEEWGTLIKLHSRFDEFPIGRIEGTWREKLGEGDEGTHIWGGHAPHRSSPVRIENMAWDYHGVMPVRFHGCVCSRSQFSLDAYERVFLPAAHKCAVDVLDANGNVIMTVGSYGNADCRGKDSPVQDPKTGELRPRRENDPANVTSPLAKLGITFLMPNFTTVDDEALYVNDLGNERARLDYHVEEIASLGH